MHCGDKIRDMEEKNSVPIGRQYWLWVTRPDYYFDEDGNEREDLDPNSGVDSDGWWTCHKDTKKGDLILLWRTSPKKDIGYLIQAESDAYSISDDNEHGWEYGCDHQMLYKFHNPIKIKNLRADPYFDEWGPLRCSFQRSFFEISKNDWEKLNQMSIYQNPEYRDIIEEIQKEPISKHQIAEEQLEEMLVSNLKILKKFGHDLELYIDPASKQSGRQFICKGNGGRIDLFCHDKIKNRYVVIELKIVRAGQNTFGQISNYIGWVQNKIAGDVPVIGIVISRGYDTKFESALRITDKISQINIDKIGLPIALPPERQRPEVAIKNDGAKFTVRNAKSRESHKWLKKGNELFDQEKFDEAIDCYDEVIKINPKNKWGWICKGEALIQLARYDEAIKFYDAISEAFSKSADVWFSKGFALRSLNNFSDALIALDKAIELRPKFADAWNGKGVVLSDMKMHDEAIQAYDKAIKIRPKFALAWSNKGGVLANLGKYDEAIQAYDKAIELDSKDAEIWNSKGVALADRNKYDEAINAIDKAIEIDPKNAIAWYNKGLVLYERDEYDEAIKAFERATAIDLKFADAWYFRGKALGQQDRHDEAVMAYDEAIKISDEAIGLNPKNAETWNTKGYALYEKENYDEAMIASNKAIELDPNNEGAWANKGCILHKQGKYNEALVALDSAIAINPKYAKVWNKKGKALKSLGRTTEANAAFAKARELGYTG